MSETGADYRMTNVYSLLIGLIHANHGGEMIDYLLSQLRDASSDVVRHGGCLGVGLAAMGTARQDVYDQLKHCLELDDAITGDQNFILDIQCLIFIIV